MSDAVPVLRIALPSPGPAIDGPGAAGQTSLRLPAAEWMVGRGERALRPNPSWRQWLLDDAGLGPDLVERFPAGPCVSMSWTGERPRGTWACAAPVHLVTAIDHLQLATPAPLPLAAAESGDLLASINAHLGGSGFRLHAFSGRGWLCECPPGLACTAVEPAVAVGRNLRELLPEGRDAARVRALVNELQMLLHEHPVNERRALQGTPAMNSLWLWGFGAAVEPQAEARGAVITNDDWLAGLWRLHGGDITAPDQFSELLRQRSTTLRVGFAPTGNDADLREQWTALDRLILMPARAALIEGAIRRVTLRIGGTVFEVTGRARWRFWRKSRLLVEALR